MRTLNNQSELSAILQAAGIQPSAFAFFLNRFAESDPGVSLTPLGELLHRQLQAQAELIEYHLRERS